jgi:hypothetical protein
MPGSLSTDCELTKVSCRHGRPIRGAPLRTNQPLRLALRRITTGFVTTPPDSRAVLCPWPASGDVGLTSPRSWVGFRRLRGLHRSQRSPAHEGRHECIEGRPGRSKGGRRLRGLPLERNPPLPRPRWVRSASPRCDVGFVRHVRLAGRFNIRNGQQTLRKMALFGTNWHCLEGPASLISNSGKNLRHVER